MILLIIFVVSLLAIFMFLRHWIQKKQSLFDSIHKVGDSTIKPAAEYQKGCNLFVRKPRFGELLFLGPSFTIVDLELAKKVMIDYHSSLLRWIPFIPKTSLFPSEGEEHARHKKVVGNALRKDFVSGMKELMRVTGTNLVEELKKEKTISDAYPFVLDHVKNAISILSFGNSKEGLKLGKLYANMLSRNLASAFLIISKPIHPLISFIPAVRKSQENGKQIELYRSILVKRLKDYLNNNNDNIDDINAEDKCLLLLILKSNRENNGLLSEDEEVGNAIGFGVGGNDSTSSGFTSMLFELAKNPDIQETVRSDRKKLNRFISEILRIYPPFASSLLRYGTQQVEIDGYTVPPGVGVGFDVKRINTNPEYFGEDAASINLESERKNQHFSFGVGPHACVGRHIALNLYQIWLSLLLDNFTISLVNPSDSTLEFELKDAVLQPKSLLSLKFTPLQ